jgi:2-keto-3-deoxy-L-rhamnonate aldolase RhmA
MVVVRVPAEDEVSLSTALDAGASGIIIPHCETREQVEEFMKRVYYRKHTNPVASSIAIEAHYLSFDVSH